MNIDSAIESVATVAKAMMGNEIEPCAIRPGSCIRREEDRPLTRLERGRGWSRRPFHSYCQEQLCDACAAYWHASMAEQAIRRIKVRQTRMEAIHDARAQAQQ